LAASVADYAPCYRGNGMIYVFDPKSEKISNVFDVSLLPADIAFGPGDSLYVASSTWGDTSLIGRWIYHFSIP